MIDKFHSEVRHSTVLLLSSHSMICQEECVYIKLCYNHQEAIALLGQYYCSQRRWTLLYECSNMYIGSKPGKSLPNHSHRKKNAMTNLNIRLVWFWPTETLVSHFEKVVWKSNKHYFWFSCDWEGGVGCCCGRIGVNIVPPYHWMKGWGE